MGVTGAVESLGTISSGLGLFGLGFDLMPKGGRNGIAEAKIEDCISLPVSAVTKQLSLCLVLVGGTLCGERDTFCSG